MKSQNSVDFYEKLVYWMVGFYQSLTLKANVNNEKIKHIKDIFISLGRTLLIRRDIIIVAFLVVVAGIVLYAHFSVADKQSGDVRRHLDVLKISDALKLSYSKNNIYPVPESAVNITASGEILTYQGYFSDSLFQTLSLEEIKDPISDKYFKYLNYYTYATDAKKQKFQIMGFLEIEGKTNYNPLKMDRKPFNYGDKVGIAIEESTSRPIHETKRSLDIFEAKEPYSIYYSDTNVISGDASRLKVLMSQASQSKSVSCREIKEAGFGTSGYYYIDPLNGTKYARYSKSMKVYCDMESDGWGWTRLYHKDGKETCSNDGMNYNYFIVEKLITKDFAVSDNLETIQSEGSWILKDIDLKNKDFSFQKLANVANCTTPIGTNWNSNYNWGYLFIRGKLQTMADWSEMFYGCKSYKKIWDIIDIRMGWTIKEDGLNIAWEFIHGICDDYSEINHSITSKWDWDNKRVIWVR